MYRCTFKHCTYYCSCYCRQPAVYPIGPYIYPGLFVSGSHGLHGIPRAVKNPSMQCWCPHCSPLTVQYIGGSLWGLTTRSCICGGVGDSVTTPISYVLSGNCSPVYWRTGRCTVAAAGLPGPFLGGSLRSLWRIWTWRRKSASLASFLGGSRRSPGSPQGHWH